MSIGEQVISEFNIGGKALTLRRIILEAINTEEEYQVFIEKLHKIGKKANAIHMALMEMKEERTNEGDKTS